MNADEAYGIISRAQHADWTMAALLERLHCSARTIYYIRSGKTRKVSGALAANLRALREELEAKK